MRNLISILVVAVLMFSSAAFAQGRRGQGQGQGIQQQKRIHTPGTAQGDQTRIQQRDRVRDGTGGNCPNASCQAQSGTQTQTRRNAGKNGSRSR